MKINRVNIGLSIEQKLNEIGMSKTEFGRKIGIPQQNVNRILDKPSIDTDKLAVISEALDFNFFDYFKSTTANQSVTSVETNGDFSPASMHGNVSVATDAVLAERVKALEALLAEKERLIKVYEKMVER